MHATAIDERQLLLEAVTLLTQLQSDTETTLHGRLDQTWRRMSVLEQRLGEFETRLTSIDDRLARLAVELRPDPRIDERVNQLRTNIDRLASRSNARATQPAARSVAVAEADRTPVVPSAVDSVTQPEPVTAPAPADEGPFKRQVEPAPKVLDYLGRTPQDRAGVILIGVGLVAVVYAALANIRF